MSQKYILVVEDEFGNAELLKFVLEINGFQVSTAANGQEALESVATNLPDLILSDVMMPLMDGKELYRQLRGNPVLQSIPVVFMSAAHEITATDLSQVPFLPKPLDIDHLLSTVSHLIQGKTA